ncbi:unnamed protein product [Pylaiella littoralis]
MIISNYKIGKEIGSGSFGTVNIAEHRGTGEKVAVKCISKSRIQRSNMGAQVKKEITTMKKLDHPNIVHIHEVLMSDSHLYLVMEFVGGGELFTKLVTSGKLAENVAKRYFKQVLEAVQFCHNLYICHRDIKPENILLDAGDNVKIADFGFASIMEPELEQKHDRVVHMSAISEDSPLSDQNVQKLPDFVPDPKDPPTSKPNAFRNLPSQKMQKMSTMCGTTHYMAPEILNRTSYRGDKADLWSCGVVLFVLLSGFLPFDSNDPDMVVLKIKSGTFVTPTSISGPAQDVIKQLLAANPILRPSAKTVLRSEWFGGVSLHRSAPAAQPFTTRSRSHHTGKREKLVAQNERKVDVAGDLETTVGKVSTILGSRAWMLRSDTTSGSSKASIKASKMTPTGLALIQVNLRGHGATTEVEVEVFGRQTDSGAGEINRLVESIRELRTES